MEAMNKQQMYTHPQHGAIWPTVGPKLDGTQERVIGGSKPFSLFLVYIFWVLMIFEVDWFLFATTGVPFYRIPMLVAPTLTLGILVNQSDKRAVYWPLILFVLLHLGASVFAENAGYSRDALKFMLYMVMLLASSVLFLDSPSKMIIVLKLYLLSFVWYSLQGLPNGRVTWHPLLANEDSYGPLMVISMAFSYFFALATSSRRWRLLARGIFFLSILGVVVSFARGASVAAGVVLLHILLRSPSRAKTLTGLVLATIVLLPVAALIVPLGPYIKEVQSSSEGDPVREALWRLAWDVFQESPLYGVGAFNFGVVAAKITVFDPTRTVGPDPAQLYSFAVHNAYLQILAEEGIIGITLWIGMVVGFFRRIRRLQTEGAIARWRGRGGEGVDLCLISRGLEGAMVGYLVNSVFYNQLYIHWFWSLVTIAYVLSGLASLSERDTTSEASENSTSSSQALTLARARV